MNTYGDEETEFARKEVKAVIKQRVIEWGKFAAIFIVGFIIITISLPFAPILLINPRPFTLLFSLGSFVILFAILSVISLQQLTSKCGSLLWFIAYLITLGLGIYSGLFHLGYFTTLGVMSVQVLSYLNQLSIYRYSHYSIQWCLNFQVEKKG